MKCVNCGADISADNKYCSHCGMLNKPQYEETVPLYECQELNKHEETLPLTNYKTSNTVSNSEPISEKDFIEKYMSKNTKGWIRAFYVLCVISIVLSIAMIGLGMVGCIVDLIVVLVIVIGFHRKKNWIFPLILAIYGIVGAVISVATGGGATGILLIIAGILATVRVKKLKNAYDDYLTTGKVPEKQI